MITRMALDFLPELPLAERVARHVLAQSYRLWRYDLVDEVELRRALSETLAGHVLQGTIDARAEVLEVEVQRVAVVIAVVSDYVGLAELEVGGDGGG